MSFATFRSSRFGSDEFVYMVSESSSSSPALWFISVEKLSSLSVQIHFDSLNVWVCMCVCSTRFSLWANRAVAQFKSSRETMYIRLLDICVCVWVFVSVFLCLCVTHAHAYILFLNIFFPNSFFSLRIFDFTTFSTSTIFHWCVANFVQSSPSISISSAVQFLLYTCVVVVCLCVCVLLSYV